MGYCPFPPCVSHDTVDCIVTQGTQQARMVRRVRPQYGQATPYSGEAGMGYCPFPPYVSHDTVDCIVTQGAQQTRMARRVRQRYGQATPTTQRGRATIQTTTRRQCAPRHGLASSLRAAWSCARSQGPLNVHPTQFLLNALF